jgi:hypothetical protein
MVASVNASGAVHAFKLYAISDVYASWTNHHALMTIYAITRIDLSIF